MAHSKALTTLKIGEKVLAKTNCIIKRGNTETANLNPSFWNVFEQKGHSRKMFSLCATSSQSTSVFSEMLARSCSLRMWSWTSLEVKLKKPQILHLKHATSSTHSDADFLSGVNLKKHLYKILLNFYNEVFFHNEQNQIEIQGNEVESPV